MASVLLIDDDPDFLKLGAAQLASRGHKVTAVPSAVEALKLSIEVDFIISDVVMEGVDGERFLDEMTKRGKSASVPILMISARKDLVQSVRMIAKGALDLARKPIDWDRIDGMIQSAGAKRKSGAGPLPPMPAAPAVGVAAANKPKVLIVEDSSTQRALWRLTLSEHVANAKIVPDGAEALKSLEAENYALLITDIDLGAISGWQVAEAARKKNPKLPIIVISSRVQTGRPADHELPGDRDKIHCFHKADRADALLQAGRILGLPPVM